MKTRIRMIKPGPVDGQDVIIEVMAQNNSPLARYRALKDYYQETLLLLGVEDFIETFDSDAEIAAAVLGRTVTRRNDGAILFGFPKHELEANITKLKRAGHRTTVIIEL